MTIWDDFIDVVKFKICQLDALKSNLTVGPQRDQLDRETLRIHRHRAKLFEEALPGRHLEARAPRIYFFPLPYSCILILYHYQKENVCLNHIV